MSEEEKKETCERCGAQATLTVTLDGKTTCPVCMIQRSKEHGDLLSRYYVEMEAEIQATYTQELSSAHRNFQGSLENLLDEVARIIEQGTGDDPRNEQ